MLTFHIIEDDATVARRYRRYIEGYDEYFQVVAVSASGAQAREHHTAHPADVILCDVEVPGELGVDVVSAFRASGWDGIAVVVSGHDEFEYARRALQVGAIEYLLKPVFKETFIQLLDRIKERVRFDYISPSDATRHNSKPAYIVRAIRYIEREYATTITLDALASEACVSESYLSAAFRKHCGMTLTEFINDHRIWVARKLLVETDHDIKVIAAEVGMNDVSYFHRCFRRITGTTPRQFRSSVARDEAS